MTEFQSQSQFMVVDTDKYIEWSDTLYLKWSDYKYRSSRGKKYPSMALTSVFHSVRGGMKAGKPNFQVKVLLVKEDSWTSDSMNIHLLAHEKLHFDIAEVYGRKIRKQIAILGNRGSKDLSEYKRYIKYFLNEFKRTSLEYDKETEHGQDFQVQLKWFNVVSSELQRLHEYM